MRSDRVGHALLDDPAAALGLKAGALFRRTESGAFEFERTLGWGH